MVAATCLELVDIQYNEGQPKKSSDMSQKSSEIC